MLSMTGFGAGKAPLASGRAGAGTREAQAEASSVNRKGLEFSISLPREWSALEAPLTELARARLQRGQVRLAVTVNEPGGAGALAWNEAAVGAALERLKELAERFEVSFEPDAELLWRLAQGTVGEAATTPAEEAWPAVQAAATAALEQLVAARRREGEALQRDLTARLALLSRLREEIAPLAGESVTRYREGLHGRLRQIGLEIDLNDERILREIALFADRCDIAEELTRLESHLATLAKTLAADGPVGRQLDFMCQEIHREINTIGSKAQHVEITRRVLEAKNEIERIREQVQNVE